MVETPERSRKALLRPVKRVVVKVGSGVLTARNGLNKRVIRNLTRDVCALKEMGSRSCSSPPALLPPG